MKKANTKLLKAIIKTEIEKHPKSYPTLPLTAEE